jgi:nucleoside-triphosphatase
MGGKPVRILLTGLPGCGKTTLIKRLLAEMLIPVSGFFTEEIRENGRRTGFSIAGMSGQKDVLAHLNISSSFHVGKYGVDIEALNRIVDAEFSEPSAILVVVDEIGNMELLSDKFKSAITRIWGSNRNVIATILEAHHPFCDALKNDSRSMIVQMNHNNREDVYRKLRNICVALLVN